MVRGVTGGPRHPGPARLTHSPVAGRVRSSSSGSSSSQEVCAGVGMVSTELLQPRLALCALGVSGKRGTRGRGTGRAKGSSGGGGGQDFSVPTSPLSPLPTSHLPPLTSPYFWTHSQSSCFVCHCIPTPHAPPSNPSAFNQCSLNKF